MAPEALTETGNGTWKNETEKFTKVNEKIAVRTTGTNDDGSMNNSQINDFFLDISKGLIEGHRSQFKFGRNSNSGTDEEVVWDGGNGYTFLDAAETMEVVSTSLDDTSAGTGARTIQILGLDDNFEELNESVTLNGTTPVTTTNSFRRVFRAIVVTDGNESATSGANQGDISITSSTSTILQAKILQYNGQTLMAIYTVPAGKTAYVTGISLNVGQGKQCLFRAKFRNCTVAGCAFSVKYALDIFENTFFGELKVPLMVPEKTDMVFTSELSSTPTVTTSASFGMILVEN